MTSSKSQRLELTWFNKDKALIPTENGKYGYSWVDPRDPRYCETHTLVEGEYIEGVQAEKEDGRSYSELADLEPTTDNLLINGESGDVLKALTRVPELADKYLGKIKLCYIDPPFNTAEAFTQANYEDNLEHSVWLTMMRDRLVHIKKLLAEDGTIWVHLDDGENHRMRVLLDEVFGPGNYVAEMQWQKTYSPRNDSKSIPMVTDPILVYRKGPAFSPNKLARTADMDGRYTNPDEDPLGPWTTDNPAAPGAATHQGMVYAIQQPITGELIYPPTGACWRKQQDELLEIMRGWGRYELVDLDDAAERARVCGIPTDKVREGVKGLVIPEWNEADSECARSVYSRGLWPAYMLTRGGTGGFRRKTYLADMGGRMPVNFLPFSEVGHTDGAKKEIRAIFPNLNAFATPKPERLLERVIHIATNPGDFVLDVFAGSGTTAAVAHKMGRRWVSAELLPETVEKFTLPRLTKVVRGEDPGGITATAGERVDATEDGLPEGLSPEEAQKLTSLLNKAIRGDEELKKDPALRKVKAMVKTRKSPDTINWRGGGGFRVATLSPECFDYDPDLGLVSLTDAAFEGDNLARTVAAHMNFHLTPEHPVFTGKRGRTRILVTTADATPEYVAELVPHLDHDEKLVLASTSVDADAQQALRKARRGSRVVHIPNDLFRVHEIEG